jgi:hypothetical protein
MRHQIPDILWRELKILTTLVFASLFLSGAAFYNGYPLVYPDTGGYIGLQNLSFRSFFYNLFIYPSLWFHSLWLIVFVQSLIVAHLLRLTLRVVFRVTSIIAYLAMIVLLCLLTNLPWFTGFIMPDIFTGVLILSLYLLIFCRETIGLRERIYLFLLTVLCATVHLSNIPLAAGMIGASWFFRVMIKNNDRLPVPHLLGASFAILLAFILIIANNYRTYSAFTFSHGGYAFLLARFVADGEAIKYLKESCPERKYKLCAYIGQLPADSDKFLWSEESPFRKVGWINGYRQEGKEIVKNTILNYPFSVIKNSFKNSILQLPMINNSYGICSYIDKPYPTNEIRKYYPCEFHAYATSRQSLNQLSLNTFNRLHRMIICFSLLITVAIFFIYLKHKQYLPLLLLISVVCAYLLSSFITGALSNPDNRYGSRIIWLLPFFSFASLIHFIHFWKEYFRRSPRTDDA